MRGWRLASLVLLLMVSVAVADEDPAKKAVDADEILMEISANDVKIEDFLRGAAMASKQSILFDASSHGIRGKTLQGQLVMRAKKDEFLARVREILFTKSLVLVPVGPPEIGTWSVLHAEDPGDMHGLAPQIIDLTDENVGHWEAQVGRFVATTLHIEHLRDLRTTRNAVTSLVSPRNIGRVTEVEEARALVVVDFAPRVAAIYRAIRRLDKPTEGSTTTAGALVAIDLKHGAAEPMAALLRAHFGSTPPRTKDKHGPLPIPLRRAADGWPRISGDARTNRLLISGTAAEVARVREAVALLDRPSGGDAAKR